jgi:hypothetical protein
MRRQKISKALLPILVLATILVNRAQPIQGATHKHDESETRVSGKGRPNTSTQWKAHPEKGWVRAGEDHTVRDGKKPIDQGSGGIRENNGAKKKH